MGKKRLPIKRRPTAAKRYTTYMKRKGGVAKKAKELSTLCATKLALLTFSPKGQANLVLGENSELAEVLEMFSKVDIKEREKRSHETLKSLRRSYIKDGQEFDMEKLTPPGPEMTEDCQKYLKELQVQIDEVNMKVRAYRNPYSVTDKRQILAMESRLKKSLEALQQRKQQLLAEKTSKEAATLQGHVEEQSAEKQPAGLGHLEENYVLKKPTVSEDRFGENLAYKSITNLAGHFEDKHGYNTNYLQGHFGENFAYKNISYFQLQGLFGEDLKYKNTTYLEEQLQQEYALKELSILRQNGLPSGNMANGYRPYTELLEHGIPLSGPYTQPYADQFLGPTEMTGIKSSLYPFWQMGYNPTWFGFNSKLTGLNFQLLESTSNNPAGFNVGGVELKSGFNVAGVDLNSRLNMGGVDLNSGFNVGEIDLNSSKLIKQDDHLNFAMLIKQDNQLNSAMLMKQDNTTGLGWRDYSSCNA